MESTKEMFELWVDAQNKLVENWVQTTKKFQGAAANGEVLTKGVEFYKEWAEAQKNIIGGSIDNAVEKANGNMPAMMQEVMKQQKEFTDKWVAMMTTAMKQPAGLTPDTFLKDTKALYDQWVHYYTDWAGKMQDMTKLSGDSPAKVAQETFNNFISTSKSYLSMLELWKPFYNMVSTGKVDYNDYMKQLGFDKFEGMSKEMFNFVSPEAHKKFFEQASNMLNSWRDALREQTKPLAGFYEQFNKMATPNAFVNMQEFGLFADMQNKMYEQLEQMTAPFAKLIPQSKAKEVAEKIVTISKDLNDYQAKYTEMQYLLATTTQKAVEQTAKELFEKAKEGKQVQTYNEFFTHTVNILEEKMLELFNSTQFSKLQGELLNIGMDIKANLEKNIEYALAPYPVVTRSEVDELTKQIHDLKAKVRTLEKALDEDELTETDGAKKATRKTKQA